MAARSSATRMPSGALSMMALSRDLSASNSASSCPAPVSANVVFMASGPALPLDIPGVRPAPCRVTLIGALMVSQRQRR